MGDEKGTGKANPDPKPDAGKEGAKAGDKPEAKPEAKAPEVPPWLPLPKDFADFLECTSDSISLAADGLSVPGLDQVLHELYGRARATMP